MQPFAEKEDCSNIAMSITHNNLNVERLLASNKLFDKTMATSELTSYLYYHNDYS